MLSLNIKKNNGLTIIYLHGSIETETIKKFEIDTNNVIKTNISILVLDFTNVERIDSVGISHLLKLSRKAILSDIELIFSELNHSLKRLFETAKMDKFFNILTNDALKEKYF